MMWRLQKENGSWCWLSETGQQRLLWLLFPASFHTADKHLTFLSATNRYSFSWTAYSHILPLRTNTNFHLPQGYCTIEWLSFSEFQTSTVSDLFIFWHNNFRFYNSTCCIIWIYLVGASQNIPLATELTDPLVILDISVFLHDVL